MPFPTRETDKDTPRRAFLYIVRDKGHIKIEIYVWHVQQSGESHFNNFLKLFVVENLMMINDSFIFYIMLYFSRFIQVENWAL